jgi:hypothetical protein
MLAIIVMASRLCQEQSYLLERSDTKLAGSLLRSFVFAVWVAALLSAGRIGLWKGGPGWSQQGYSTQRIVRTYQLDKVKLAVKRNMK